MKETRNISLSLYELIAGLICVEKIESNVLKVFVALPLIILLIFFALLALLIEEPIKCILSLILFRTTPNKAWIYYKRCWISLFLGYKSVK